MTETSVKDIEQQLIAEVQRGNSQAFRPLVEKYWGLVNSIISKYIKCRETADDICQEAFIAAFAHLASYRNTCRFSPWLVKIAVNKALEHIRRESRAVFVDFDLDFVISSVPTPEDAFEQKDFFDQCLTGLPEHLQIMFILRHGADLSYEEMAQVFDVPVGTVKSLMFRIRGQLKTLIESRDRDHKVLSSEGLE